MQLAMIFSETEYTCGSPAVPPDHVLHKKVEARINLACGDMVEMSYYASKIGRSDICCYCGCKGAPQEAALLNKFKTVLPLCNTCKDKGLKPACFRPFGKKK